MSVGRIKSGSAFVFYETFGDKANKPLVLLHGNGESRQHFKKHIEILKDKYFIIAVDSRGHGESGFGFNSLSLSMMVIDLENVLKDVGVDKAYFCGFSDGANVALLFAVKNPEKVLGLVPVSGNLFFKGLTFRTRFWIAFGYYFSKIAGLFDKRNKIYNEFYLIMYKEPDIIPDILQRVEAPAMVIAGTKDMVRTEHSKLIANSLKNARLQLIEGADHFFVYKEVERFCEILDDFISKN